MNERIKELVKKHGVDITIDGMGYGEGNIEGLAELIVRECAKAADEGLAQVTMKVEWPSYHIKKHFGVKE
jgi:hypothetical protein